MPRIDPLQLLKCLSVLLSPEGGILSRNEVPRLVSLMTKFSKKLVSKCVYVLILKNTETSLVDMFMAEQGWTLVQNWLQDAVPTGNWDLVKEILELLLVTPVDVERLKLNCLPKLIKSLTRKEGQPEVAALADRIVQNWLNIVKGSASTIASTPAPVATPKAEVKEEPKPVEPVDKPNEIKLEPPEAPMEEAINEAAEENVDANDSSIKTDSLYSLTVKDGKQIIRKLSSEKDNEKDETNKKNDKEKSSKSSSSSRSKSGSSSRDKDRHKSSSRSSSSSSKSSSSSSRDKSRDKDRDGKDKDRKSSSSKSSSRSSSTSSSSRDKKDSKEKSKDTKENQVEKDKDTLEKLKPKSVKLARIPRLSSNDKPKESKSDRPKENKSDDKPKENNVEEVKKPSFSILNRKSTGEERGKTVKVFNSKMRSTGLEEMAKPPPPRSSKKPTPSIQLPTIPPKRPSPPRDLSASMVPPEKKIKIDKIDKPDRPGAIKLIAPKPKPAVLLESDMFGDALTAAAPKKDKKRKRRLSATKEAPESPSSSQEPSSAVDTSTPTSPTPSSPTTLKNIAPINFYQDTLSEQSDKNEIEKEDEGDAEDNNEENNPKDDDGDDDAPGDSPTADISIEIDSENMPSPPKQIKLAGELKGILVHEKKPTAKRSIQWKEDKDLVETRYFELDETERINVTKTFTDMAKMDIDGEREAMINSRISSEDKMAPAMQWYAPFLCDNVKVLAAPGAKSLEKDIQFAREKSTPPAEYFNKRMIPDSPKEPEMEVHQKSDPFSIPLDDPEGHVVDLQNKPWPESKGLDPQLEVQQQMPTVFPNNMPFNPNFNNLPPGGVPFVGMPQRFPGPPGPHGPMMGPANFNPPHMMHNNMVVPPMNQPDMMNGGPMNPGMFVPGPEGFMGVPNEQPYPMPPFNGGPPQGPMYGPNNFNHQRGGNNGGRGGGARRGGGGGGWVQVNGPRPWRRGSGPHRGGNRPCKNIQNHGYCRNLDTCPFRH